MYATLVIIEEEEGESFGIRASVGPNSQLCDVDFDGPNRMTSAIWA